MSKKIGYARVSTDGQTTDAQLDALAAAGCTEVHQDSVSGGSTKRPGLDAALASLAAGDTLVVWKLDRLGRSLGHLIQIVASLKDRGVAFHSLSDGIDTSTAAGQLMFHVVGALAEFERSLISERTKASLAAIKDRGGSIGRRPSVNKLMLKHARDLVAGGHSVSDVARTLGVGRSTLYRAIG